MIVRSAGFVATDNRRNLDEEEGTNGGADNIVIHISKDETESRSSTPACLYRQPALIFVATAEELRRGRGTKRRC